jgi:wobble nucleotide-excising tRNase
MVRRKKDEVGVKPIVVIDDPVTSLDEASFVGISAAIWGLFTSDQCGLVDQLILMTHSFELFRQWDTWHEHLPRAIKPKLACLVGCWV